jgi:hypothetical protein
LFPFSSESLSHEECSECVKVVRAQYVSFYPNSAVIYSLLSSLYIEKVTDELKKVLKSVFPNKLKVCQSIYLLIYSLAYLLTYLLISLFTYFLTSLLPYFLPSFLAYLLTYIHTFSFRFACNNDLASH